MPTTPILLYTYTASSAVSTISFTGITQSYTDLWITLSNRGNNSSGDQWSFDSYQLNGITTNTYDVTSIRGYVGGVDGGTNIGQANWPGGYSTSNGSEANSFGCGYIYIANYANASNRKNIRFGNYNTNNQSVSYNNDSAHYWQNAGAVTSILFTPINGSTQFMTNSQIRIYGI
jgi:hypothetical protein